MGKLKEVDFAILLQWNMDTSKTVNERIIGDELHLNENCALKVLKKCLK